MRQEENTKNNIEIVKQSMNWLIESDTPLKMPVIPPKQRANKIQTIANINEDHIREYTWLIMFIGDLVHTNKDGIFNRHIQTMLRELLKSAITHKHNTMIEFLIKNKWIVDVGELNGNIISFLIENCITRVDIMEMVIIDCNECFPNMELMLASPSPRNDLKVLHGLIQPNLRFKRLVKFISEEYWNLFDSQDIVGHILSNDIKEIASSVQFPQNLAWYDYITYDQVKKGHRDVKFNDALVEMMKSTKSKSRKCLSKFKFPNNNNNTESKIPRETWLIDDIFKKNKFELFAVFCEFLFEFNDLDDNVNSVHAYQDDLIKLILMKQCCHKIKWIFHLIIKHGVDLEGLQLYQSIKNKKAEVRDEADKWIYFLFNRIIAFLQNADKNIKDVELITNTFKNNVMAEMTQDERHMYREFDKDFKNENEENKDENKDENKLEHENGKEDDNKLEHENESTLSLESMITHVLMSTFMLDNTVLLDIILTEIGQYDVKVIQNVSDFARNKLLDSIRRYFESGENEKSLSLWMSLLYKYDTLWKEHSDINVRHESYLYKHSLLLKSKLQISWHNLDIPTYDYDTVLIDIISKGAVALFDYLYEHLESDRKKDELKQYTLRVLGKMFEEASLNRYPNMYNNNNNNNSNYDSGINHNNRLRFLVKLFEYYEHGKKNLRNLQQIESQIISYRYNVKIIDFFKNHQNPQINYDFTQNVSFWQSCVNKNNIGLIKHYRQEFISNYNRGRFHDYPQLQKDLLSVINNNSNSFPICESKMDSPEYQPLSETPTGVGVSYNCQKHEMKFDQCKICEGIYKNDMKYLKSLETLSADDREKISASDKIRGFAMAYRNEYVLDSWFSGWQEELNQLNLNCINDYEQDKQDLNTWKEKYSHNNYQIINHEIENAIIYFYQRYHNDQPTFAKFVFEHIIMNKKYFVNKETKYSIDNDIAAMKSTKEGFYLFHSILEDVSCENIFIQIMNSNKIKSATAANDVYPLLTVNNNNKLPIECLVYGSYNEKYQNLKFAKQVQNDIHGSESSAHKDTFGDAMEWIQWVYKLKANTIQLKFDKIQ